MNPGITNVIKTFDIIKTLWPLWLLIGIIVILRVFFEGIFPALLDRWRNHRRFIAGEKWRSDRELLQWLRGMQPSEFEDYIADLFKKLGYKTEVTGGSHDQGVDVIAKKDNIEHYIQCKKFITSIVSVGAVRDFYGATADHLARGKGYFITTNKFTLDAEKFADDKPIELIDGYKLIEYIHLAEKNDTISNSIF
jgi:HJR/Mrr/RecB family endonuclease